MPLAVKAQSPNHWTSREVPLMSSKIYNLKDSLICFLSSLGSLSSIGVCSLPSLYCFKEKWVQTPKA